MSVFNKNHGSLSLLPIHLITAYIIILLFYSLGESFFYTKTIWDNVFSTGIHYFTERMNFHSIVRLLGIPVIIYLIYSSGKKLISLDTLWLIIYSAILLCTAIAYPELGTNYNIIQTLYIIEPLFICYYISRIFTKSMWEFMIKKIILICTFFWGIGCAFSFVYYLIGYQSFYKFGNAGWTNPQGVMYGRLFGAFSDPNYAAINCLILGIGSVFLLRSTKQKKITKLLLYVCLGLYAIYMVLSFSRTVVVAIAILGFFISAYSMFRAKEEKKHSIVSTIAHILLRFILFLLMLFIVYYAILCVCQLLSGFTTPSKEWSDSVRFNVWEKGAYTSNERVQIWGDYLVLSEDHPFFGFSADGALKYAEIHYPWSFISVTMYTCHNMLLQLLTQSGWIGLFDMGMFLLVPVFRFIWSIIKGKLHHPRYIYLLFLWCTISLTTGMFYNCGVTKNILFVSEILWLSLGGLHSYVQKES